MAEVPGRSVLSRELIRQHLVEGNIVIDPFDERSLKTVSYDVRLGRHYFREQPRHGTIGIFNPFDKAHVRQYWGESMEAVRVGDWAEKNGLTLKNLKPDDEIITVHAGETILSHTEEFIGGRACVTSEMRARSSLGRVGISVCKCAGWGDVGFVNRWTMEITNHLPSAAVVLVVGMRISQIVFYQVDPVKSSYAREAGKYQVADEIEELKRSWSPEAMLPRLYQDYELAEGFPRRER